MQPGRLSSVFQQGAPVSCQGLTGAVSNKHQVEILWNHLAEKCHFREHLTSSYPFVSAGSTQTAKESIDHLNGTQNQLQAACGQQSSEQSNVELHNVLRLCAFSPPCLVSQVARVTVWQKSFMGTRTWETYTVPSESYSYVCHLSLKGVVQIRRTLQRGPFCKPSTATIKLYRAPATPTAANAIDKNICRRNEIKQKSETFLLINLI